MVLIIRTTKKNKKKIGFIIWGVLSDIVIIILAILFGLKCDKYSRLHRDYNSLEKSYNRLQRQCDNQTYPTCPLGSNIYQKDDIIISFNAQDGWIPLEDAQTPTGTLTLNTNGQLEISGNWGSEQVDDTIIIKDINNITSSNCKIFDEKSRECLYKYSCDKEIIETLQNGVHINPFSNTFYKIVISNPVLHTTSENATVTVNQNGVFTFSDGNYETQQDNVIIIDSNNKLSSNTVPIKATKDNFKNTTQCQIGKDSQLNTDCLWPYTIQSPLYTKIGDNYYKFTIAGDIQQDAPETITGEIDLAEPANITIKQNFNKVVFASGSQLTPTDNDSAITFEDNVNTTLSTTATNKCQIISQQQCIYPLEVTALYYQDVHDHVYRFLLDNGVKAIDSETYANSSNKAGSINVNQDGSLMFNSNYGYEDMPYVVDMSQNDVIAKLPIKATSNHLVISTTVDTTGQQWCKVGPQEGNILTNATDCLYPKDTSINITKLGVVCKDSTKTASQCYKINLDYGELYDEDTPADNTITLNKGIQWRDPNDKNNLTEVNNPDLFIKGNFNKVNLTNSIMTDAVTIENSTMTGNSINLPGLNIQNSTMIGSDINDNISKGTGIQIFNSSAKGIQGMQINGNSIFEALNENDTASAGIYISNKNDNSIIGQKSYYGIKYETNTKINGNKCKVYNGSECVDISTVGVCGNQTMYVRQNNRIYKVDASSLQLAGATTEPYGTITFGRVPLLTLTGSFENTLTQSSSDSCSKVITINANIKGACAPLNIASDTIIESTAGAGMFLSGKILSDTTGNDGLIISGLTLQTTHTFDVNMSNDTSKENMYKQETTCISLQNIVCDSNIGIKLNSGQLFGNTTAFRVYNQQFKDAVQISNNTVNNCLISQSSGTSDLKSDTCIVLKE